ncbi:DUF3224 domain-containing protein [Saccharothrix violaceirubra]|uniref:DUF3224 domain-containing protein n=1 Tax=Saccharothrix violaceirubra TaxID=413306 RepID=A0A7W7TAV0_9PSEU|nr:DUF3224 domain-containing protein [Saccharothrix violaceirubra]MBB4968415.1 hypothetical protein [Saccharothrix violaceirubra]
MEAEFDITRWEETVLDATEPPIGRVGVGKTYTGVLAGTSTGELTTCQAGDAGAGYVGTERFTGTFDGRTGTVVFQHGATMSPAGPVQFGHVVPGSGTDGLAGLTGSVRLDHGRITLDLRFG